MSDRKIKHIKVKDRKPSPEDNQKRHELGLLQILMEKYFPNEASKLFPKSPKTA